MRVGGWTGEQECVLLATGTALKPEHSRGGGVSVLWREIPTTKVYCAHVIIKKRQQTAGPRGCEGCAPLALVCGAGGRVWGARHQRPPLTPPPLFPTPAYLRPLEYTLTPKERYWVQCSAERMHACIPNELYWVQCSAVQCRECREGSQNATYHQNMLLPDVVLVLK